MRISDWSSDVCSSDLRIDRRLDDAPRRAPVGRGDEADAARVGFELGAVHALTGEAGALVDLSHVEGRSLVLSISRPARSKARLPASSPAFWPIVRPAAAVTCWISGINRSTFAPVLLE